MSGISVGVIILVGVLSTFCLAALLLHLIKGSGDGYFKVKFGLFVFEYGRPPKASEESKPTNAVPTDAREGGETDTPSLPGP